MAQILKEEVRQRILAAAEDSLYRQGTAVTMRQIAKAAGLTPGNLYRYYASKEELLAAVTEPVLQGLDQLVRRHTGAHLVLGQTGFQLPQISPPQLRRLMYAALVPAIQDLCGLAVEYPRPMAILCQQSETNQALMSWFYGLLHQVLYQLLRPQPADSLVVELLALTEGQAFCQGVVVLLQQCDQVEPQRLQKTIHAFLSIQIEGILNLLQEVFRANDDREEECRQ